MEARGPAADPARAGGFFDAEARASLVGGALDVTEHGLGGTGMRDSALCLVAGCWLAAAAITVWELGFGRGTAIRGVFAAARPGTAEHCVKNLAKNTWKLKYAKKATKKQRKCIFDCVALWPFNWVPRYMKF